LPKELPWPKKGFEQATTAIYSERPTKPSTMVKKKGLVDFVRDAILASGYPLELEATRMLESKGWSTSNNQPYAGLQGGVRSIDISAQPPDMLNLDDKWKVKYDWGRIDGILSPFVLSPEMCVECKKSTKAWVFFRGTWDLGPIFRPGYCGQIFDDMYRRWGSSILMSNIESDPLTAHYKSAGNTAISFSEVSLGGKTSTGGARKKPRKEIFTALMQLLNYITFDYKNNLRNRKYLLYDFKYPVIVLDGQLFSAELKHGNLVVEPSEHVVLEHTHVDRDLWGHEGRVFYIDVVTKKHFPALIEAMTRDVTEFSMKFVGGLEDRKAKLQLVSKPAKRKARQRR